jgi:hypothetical protein
LSAGQLQGQLGRVEQNIVPMEVLKISLGGRQGFVNAINQLVDLFFERVVGLLFQHVLAHDQQSIVLIHAGAQLVSAHRLGFAFFGWRGCFLCRRVGGIRRYQQGCDDASASQQAGQT